jgi:hypothetical protein
MELVRKVLIAFERGFRYPRSHHYAKPWKKAIPMRSRSLDCSVLWRRLLKLEY